MFQSEPARLRGRDEVASLNAVLGELMRSA